MERALGEETEIHEGLDLQDLIAENIEDDDESD